MTEPNPAYSDPTLETGRFSGLYPDNTYPEVDGELDEEQQKRLQARQEHDRTPRESSDDPYADHPPLTEKYNTNDHALRRAQEEEEAAAE